MNQCVISLLLLRQRERERERENINVLVHRRQKYHIVITLSGCVVTERLVKLMDYYEGSFQDFVGHSDSVGHVRFATSTKLLFTAADSELFVWTVCV